MFDVIYHVAHYRSMTSHSYAGFAKLQAGDATQAVAEHPELAEVGVEDPVVFLASARDSVEAAELEDLLAAARSMLRTHQGRAHEILRALLPAASLTISHGVLAQIERNAQAQRQLADEFGLYSSADVAARRGSRASNSAALASRWRAQGRLFSVDVESAVRYPGFQFAFDGHALPVIADIVSAFSGRLSGWELALWFTGSNDWLGGVRPVDVLEGTDSDRTQVVEAARHLADELTT